MKESEKKPEFLTARQLAEILQVSEATIHRLRRQGRIPAMMLTERLIRFNLKDVKAALGYSRPRREDEEKESESAQLSFEDLFAGFR